jgi:hypothetical protein
MARHHGTYCMYSAVCRLTDSECVLYIECVLSTYCRYSAVCRLTLGIVLFG